MRAFFTCCIVLALALPAQAARLPLPPSQWNPRVHLTLAQCVVGEGGWLSRRDHDGIAWVLARRWRMRIQRHPLTRFVDVMHVYCKALGAGRREPTARQRWVRALRGAAIPEGWPRNASWARHLPWWRAAYQRIGQWQLGKVRDPCRGRALHWGGDMDIPLAEAKGLVEIDCGDTENTFFGVPK